MKNLVATLFAVLAIASAAPSWAQKAAGSPDDPVYNYTDTDAAMNAAVEDARRSYPQFMATLTADSVSNRAANYLIKVGLPTPDGGHEHIWVDSLRFEGGALVGALANIPDNLPGMSQGSRVEIDEALVSDWSIITAEGMYGSFTTRVMLDVIPPDQAAQMRQVLTRDPLPADWHA